MFFLSRIRPKLQARSNLHEEKSRHSRSSGFWVRSTWTTKQSKNPSSHSHRAKNGETTSESDQGYREAAKQVLGRASLPQAVQGWKLRAERSCSNERVSQESQADLQMGAR